MNLTSDNVDEFVNTIRAYLEVVKETQRRTRERRANKQSDAKEHFVEIMNSGLSVEDIYKRIACTVSVIENDLQKIDDSYHQECVELFDHLKKSLETLIASHVPQRSI
jgi:hypothetical protein